MTEDSKVPIKLHVNGQFVGYIEKLEYERPVQELPSVDGYARFAPGNEIRLSVELTTPVSLQEKWRLVEKGEEVRDTDEWYSVVEMQWYPLSMFYPNIDCKLADDDLYRRKVLVCV